LGWGFGGGVGGGVGGLWGGGGWGVGVGFFVWGGVWGGGGCFLCGGGVGGGLFVVVGGGTRPSVEATKLLPGRSANPRKEGFPHRPSRKKNNEKVSGSTAISLNREERERYSWETNTTQKKLLATLDRKGVAGPDEGPSKATSYRPPVGKRKKREKIHVTTSRPAGLRNHKSAPFRGGGNHAGQDVISGGKGGRVAHVFAEEGTPPRVKKDTKKGKVCSPAKGDTARLLLGEINDDTVEYEKRKKKTPQGGKKGRASPPSEEVPRKKGTI